MNYLESPNGQSPFEAVRKPKACTQRIGASVNRISHRGPLRAGVAAPHPRSRKGIVHLFFAEKKTCKIRKTRKRVFPQHFSREGAILRRQSPFEAARKSSICTHQPKQSTRTQEKCDSSEGCKPEAESKSLICEREDSRRRASRRLACRLK